MDNIISEVEKNETAIKNGFKQVKNKAFKIKKNDSKEKNILLAPMLHILFIIVVLFTACHYSSDSSSASFTEILHVVNFEELIAAIDAYGKSENDIAIIVDNDILLDSEVPIPYNKYDATLTIQGNIGNEKLIRNSLKCIRIGTLGQENMTLILKNITIDGGDEVYSLEEPRFGTETRSSLINVFGTLILEDGAILTNSKESRAVSLLNNRGKSTFIMNEGVISNCSSLFGSAVYVAETSTFILNNGVIEKNYALPSNHRFAGTVYVSYQGHFIMNGGEIRLNKAGQSESGDHAPAGVCIDQWGIFTMNGGSIHDNVSEYSWGNGVAGNSGFFNMTGGSIYNNISSGGGGVYSGRNNVFTMSGGKIFNNHSINEGGGVAIYGNFHKFGGFIYGNHSDSKDDNISIGDAALFVSNTRTVLILISIIVLLSIIMIILFIGQRYKTKSLKESLR